MNFYLYKGAWLYDAQPRNLRERERALGAPLKYARARKFNKAPITRNAHFASYVPLPASSLIIFPFKVAECSFSLPSFFLTRRFIFQFKSRRQTGSRVFIEITRPRRPCRRPASGFFRRIFVTEVRDYYCHARRQCERDFVGETLSMMGFCIYREIIDDSA